MIVLYIWNHFKKSLKLDDIYYEKKIRENCYFSRALLTLATSAGLIKPKMKNIENIVFLLPIGR